MWVDFSLITEKFQVYLLYSILLQSLVNIQNVLEISLDIMREHMQQRNFHESYVIGKQLLCYISIRISMLLIRDKIEEETSVRKSIFNYAFLNLVLCNLTYIFTYKDLFYVFYRKPILSGNVSKYRVYKTIL